MPTIILSNAQLNLIQKAFSNTKTSKFNKIEKEEMTELSECFDFVIDQNDEDAIHDLEMGSEI